MSIRVGDPGVACTDLRPIGFVVVAGDRYDARVPHGVIPLGTPVVAIGSDHAGLIVQPAASVSTPLPNHGAELLVGFSERVDADTARCEAETAVWTENNRQWGTQVASITGAVSAAACAGWLWNDLPGAGEPYLAAVGLVGFGAAAGLVLFRILDSWAAGVDTGFRRVTPAAAPLGMIGAFATAAGCVPVLSLPLALTAAIAVGLVGVAVPFLFALLAGDG